MSSSRVGKAAEKRVREDLVSNGYRLIQTHLSRTAADVHAGKSGQRLAIQVKRTPKSGGGVGVAEWNELIDIAADFDAIPLIAFAPDKNHITYHRITGRKDGSGRRQPWEPFAVDFTEGAP